MTLLSLKEAAQALATGLGWPVRPGDVKDAVECGRLGAEKDPRGWGRYLVPEEEVRRLIEENRANKTPDEARRRTEELLARTWESLPRRSWDVLWRVEWRRRPKEPKPVAADSPQNKVDDAGAGLARDLARLEEKRREKHERT